MSFIESTKCPCRRDVPLGSECDVLDNRPVNALKNRSRFSVDTETPFSICDPVQVNKQLKHGVRLAVVKSDNFYLHYVLVSLTQSGLIERSHLS
jgi:hypothetical protein